MTSPQSRALEHQLITSAIFTVFETEVVLTVALARSRYSVFHRTFAVKIAKEGDVGKFNAERSYDAFELSIALNAAPLT